MLEEAVFILFTLVSLGVVLLKLLNVMQAGDFYDPEWSVVTFVALVFSFMFILFMVLNGAAENPELISYLWGHTLFLIVGSILFVAEVFLWFFHLMPKQPGGEKYGERGRLVVDRRK
jgi:hypothetical protein